MGADLGPVVIGMVLFVLLTPGLLFQIPGRSGKFIELGTMQTSGPSIFIHAIVYFALFTLLLHAIGIHIHIG